MKLPRRPADRHTVVVTVAAISPALHSMLHSLRGHTIDVRHRRYCGTARLLSSTNHGMTVEALDDVSRLEPLITFLPHAELRSVTDQHHGP